VNKGNNKITELRVIVG